MTGHKPWRGTSDEFGRRTFAALRLSDCGSEGFVGPKGEKLRDFQSTDRGVGLGKVRLMEPVASSTRSPPAGLFRWVSKTAEAFRDRLFDETLPGETKRIVRRN